MIDRRRLMLAGGAAALAGFGLPLQRASAAGTLRVASLKFGSLSWLLETIRAEGLADKAGVNITVVEVATNQAGPVALLSGEADVIVSDWPWALRQRALGEHVKFAPYSSALGAVMVPPDSPIQKLGDLKGKKLGVAGGAIDKSWLLLRAYSRKELGTDIAQLALPSYGAAPLLTEETRSGRLDAVLNFWTYAARLQGDNYRAIIEMDDVLKALGIAPVPSLVGFIWREETEAKKGTEIATFLSAVEQGNAVLATSDAAWDRIRHLVRPESDAEFAAIKAYYRAGIPTPWTGAETRSAEKLTQVLVDIGGAQLLGSDTQFDPKLFHAAGS
ncbi:MAG: ABC transporter substrate-binding protein [Hyphomicrobium sp.]|uniref:ABC transporter substrate-binding protein n=1 Tax=Hyphomicrobium sp. TaxID=82 RepID=UPI001326213F|nr:ABC transporter substrate-binding protein [Hyphomicrobium sp.]KAB2940490.1 MAG: ABC transporter substrate-binding protein [Hyphomicrobium sp.]MBZ0210847.1 ABC transporter substrate-binding protein [Hyphomicrobium sp.]